MRVVIVVTTAYVDNAAGYSDGQIRHSDVCVDQ